MDSNLQIISFNVGGLSANKLTELKYFTDNNPNIHIICLQEPNFPTAQ
jgi:exonuclease III